MSFNVIEFFQDHSIYYLTAGTKHCQPGWVQTECPFCSGNAGEHLGFNVEKDFFNCWRCGWHPTIEVIKTLTNSDWSNAKKMLTDYRGKVRTSLMPAKSKKARGWGNEIKLPYPISSLTPSHSAYIESRGYDAKKISKLWGLQSAGAVGRYKHRIIAPIIFKDQIVSYQARDITGRANLPYKACREEDEIIHHKNIVYGLNHALSKSCVVVEGLFDVWRMGPGAIATFGTSVKMSQILLIAEFFKYVYIMFDNESQAQKNADEMGATLAMLDCEVERCIIDHGDPGDLKQRTADRYMQELIA